MPGPDETTSDETTPARGATAVLITMCLGLMLSMFNSTLVNVTLPEIGATTHASPTDLQWVSTTYTLCYGSLLLSGGALGNRFGRRAAFLMGVVIFIVGSSACALAPGLVFLLGARAVQAVGVAIMLPQTLSILAHEYLDPRARARAIGVWAGVASFGLAAGPVLGGIILTVSTWRAGFVLSIVLGIVTGVLGAVFIPLSRHGRPDETPTPDILGALLGALCLTALVYGLIESATLGWDSPIIVGTFVVSALAVALFVWTQRLRERRGRRPLMPLELWRSRGFIAANLAGLAYFLTFFGILYFYSLDLQREQHYSPLVTGLVFLPMTIFMALLAPVAGRLAARVGTAPVMTVGLVVAAVGCLLLALLPDIANVLDLEWRLALVGIGAGHMSSSMSNLAVSSVDSRHSSTASAVHNTFRQIGATLGVAGLGTIVNATIVTAAGSPTAASHAAAAFGLGLDHAMGVVAFVLAVCAVGAWSLTRRRPLNGRAT
jgi:EmrB/QacA subfamily drug resistance transporter